MISATSYPSYFRDTFGITTTDSSPFLGLPQRSVIVPVLMTVALLLAWLSINRVKPGRLWLTFFAAVALATMISLINLLPTVIFMGRYERNFYALPGFSGLFESVIATLRLIFVDPVGSDLVARLSDESVYIGRHELEESITPVALAYLLGGLITPRGPK